MVLEFAFLPPEINSALIFGGAGAGSLFAAASAWAELASNLASSASSFNDVVSGLTSGQWTGPSAEAMSQAAGPYLQWLSSAISHAEGSATQANAAASAFETAFAATVHPVAVTTNRTTLMSLIATNFLGQNTPAIFAIELEYIEMWAQDVAAMFGYHAGAASVASALPSITSAPSSLAGLFTTPLESLASSAGSIFGPGLSSFVGAAQTAVAEMSSLFSVPAVSSLTTVAQVGMYPASAVVPPMMVLAHGGTPASAVGAAEVLAGAPGFVGSTAPATQALGSSGGWGSAMSAGLGSARFVGAISAMSGLEGAAPGVSAGATGPTGLPVVPPNGTAPGTPGAGNGRGNPRATHVVQSRPRVVPRTEVG
jgi:PPE-repeat protein